ncbi:MAG: TIM barrel protein [Limnochordia bacterium]|jgi:deoxyribonuclease-4|nr:TIM barrel protein [Limnochordia bacterium]
MRKLRIGTAGIPASTKPRGTANAILRLAELGLGHLEIEFVRGVRMGENTAREIKALAEEHDISLTVHAPYYVNLNSAEPEKIAASKDRIIQAAQAGAWAGAKSVTFHAAYYHDDDPEEVFRRVKLHMADMLERLEREGIAIRLSPETTGGPTQFGTLEELVRLGVELPGVYPCVDFSHLFARSLGEFNSYEHFVGALELIRDNLGEQALQEQHIHLSGIEYGAKGEKRHLPLAETELKYDEVLKALLEFDVAGWLVCESPILEEDALILQGLYHELRST